MDSRVWGANDMTDIIKLAREAGLCMANDEWPLLKRFAELVAAQEREACAKVADGFAETSQYQTQRKLAEWCASNIRARAKEQTP